MNSNNQSSDDEDNKKEEEPETPISEEQRKMKKILLEKKTSVIKQLIEGLSHRNSDIEASLNSVAVLTELIEIDSTFELFFAKDAAFIS